MPNFQGKQLKLTQYSPFEKNIRQSQNSLRGSLLKTNREIIHRNCAKSYHFHCNCAKSSSPGKTAFWGGQKIKVSIVSAQKVQRLNLFYSKFVQNSAKKPISGEYFAVTLKIPKMQKMNFLRSYGGNSFHPGRAKLQLKQNWVVTEPLPPNSPSISHLRWIFGGQPMNFLHTYDGKDDYFTVTWERTSQKAL